MNNHRNLTSYFKKYLLFLVLFLSLTSCQESKEEMQNPTADIRNQWDIFIAHWENKDAPALANLYTENGLNIPPGLKINNGRDEIAEFYNMLFTNHASSQYQHFIHSLSYKSDMAIEYGQFIVDWVRHDGKEWTYNARSATHWEKSDDGKWRIKLLVFNTPPEESGE